MADYKGALGLYDPEGKELRADKDGRGYYEDKKERSLMGELEAEAYRGKSRPGSGMLGSAQPEKAKPVAPMQAKAQRPKTYEEMQRDAAEMQAQVNATKAGWEQGKTAVDVAKEDELPEWLRTYAKSNGMM
jgi:hypothetical protein